MNLPVLLLAATVSASSPPDSLLREVQVSAVRRLSDTGLQKTELDTVVLRQDMALSMADILTRHSALFIKSYGRATESTAEFRGTSPSHTQVLWNGMRINSPMLGTVDFSTIPSYFIDRATLLHGASSLTVASGGLGGAVDLATQPVADAGLTTQYIQGVGSYATFDEFLRVAYGRSRWRTSTRIGYASSQNDFHYTNYDKKVDERDAAGTIVRSYHPTERNRSGYFRDLNVLQEVYFDSPAAGRFSIAAWYAHSLRGLPFLSVDYRDDSDFTNEHLQDVLRSVAAWKKGVGAELALEARVGYTFQDITYDYSTTHGNGDAETVATTITHSDSHAHQAFAQARADWAPAADWLLTADVALTYDHVRSSDRSPFHIGDNYNRGRTEVALALSAKWHPTRRWALSAVVRQEAYGSDVVAPVPALFCEYTILPGLVAKASVARNHRYPSMDDLYFRPGGNPDLRPEHGFTYDGGLELNRSWGPLTLHANVAAYDSHITDWILWTPNARGYWQPANMKRVHNYGVELSAEPELCLPHDWTVAVTANYAFTPAINRSRDLDDADTSFGKQLVYVPRHTANVAARVQWRDWSLAYLWHTYSERFTTTSNEADRITGRLKPYYMSDVTLERRFRWRHMEASVKCAVYNLLGSEYVTVLSRPMAGRHFEIFLELKPLWQHKEH